MARVLYEQRSVLRELETYLTGKGWTDITFTDGKQSDRTITNPHVAVTFPPSGFKNLQLGKGLDKYFGRKVYVNAYMESEQRASGILDDIMDFMDETCVDIIDPQGTNLGYLVCPNSETIIGEVFDPTMAIPKNVRWRSVAKGDFEAFYPAP